MKQVPFLLLFIVVRFPLGKVTSMAFAKGKSSPFFVSQLTCVFREADCEGRSEDLLLEEILLVEEEDDGGVPEPLVVADGVEQLQALLHAILEGKFKELFICPEVIFRNGCCMAFRTLVQFPKLNFLRKSSKTGH